MCALPLPPHATPCSSCPLESRNDLVTDMLSTAEIMAGNFELAMDPVNLSEICDRVCDAVRPRVRRGVRLVNAIEGVGMVEADAARVFKIFSHLVDNAVKFTFRGFIEVRAAVMGAADAQFVRVDVVDSGCGIKREQLGSIWERFQQGDMSDTRDYGGTGLGLSLVKQLVHAHGGEVGVVSTRKEGVGQGGTTFSFTLPMTREQRADAAVSLRAVMSTDLAQPLSVGSSSAEVASLSALSSAGTKAALTSVVSSASAPKEDSLSPLASPIPRGPVAGGAVGAATNSERPKVRRWHSGGSKREMFVSSLRNLNAGIEEGNEHELEEERHKVRQLQKTVLELEGKLARVSEEVVRKQAAMTALEARMQEMAAAAAAREREMSANMEEARATWSRKEGEWEGRWAEEEQQRREEREESRRREELTATLQLMVARMDEERHRAQMAHRSTSSGWDGGCSAGMEPSFFESSGHHGNDDQGEMRPAPAKRDLVCEGLGGHGLQHGQRREGETPAGGHVECRSGSDRASATRHCAPRNPTCQTKGEAAERDPATTEWGGKHDGGEEGEGETAVARMSSSSAGECANCRRAQRQLVRAVKALHAARQGVVGKQYAELIQSTAFVRAASAGSSGCDFGRLSSDESALAEPGHEAGVNLR